MTWRIIDKSKTIQPESGGYSDWKELIREEGNFQCVYCFIGEPRFGGYRNFHVEHYRPKKHFPNLRDVVENLFYVCSICNSFKGSDWPAEPVEDWSVACYPDPSKVDYNDFLVVDAENIVCSTVLAGRYVIERLYLNRLQLVHVRALDRTLDSIVEMNEEIRQNLHLVSNDLKAKLADVLVPTIDLLARLQKINPYEPDDVRR
jgi:HNH endonuclease